MRRHRMRRRYGRSGGMLPGMEGWMASDASTKAAHDFDKVEATSKERYNGGARIKRQYGSSTVTRFFVSYKRDRNDASKWQVIEGYGKTPGERKTYAIQRFLEMQSGPKPPMQVGKVW